MYRQFWRIFVKEYGRLHLAVAICGLTIVSAMLEGVNIGLLVPLLETLNSSDGEGVHWLTRGFSNLFGAVGISFQLETILLTLGLLVASITGLKYLREILVARTRVDLIVWMRTRNMGGMLNADISYFHRERLGTLTNTLVTQAIWIGSSLFTITEIIASLAIVLAYLTAAFLIDPALTAISLALMGLVILSVQHIVRRSKALGQAAVSRQYDLESSALESLSGIHMVKSFLLEGVRLLDFYGKAREVGEVEFHMYRNRALMVAYQEMILFVLIGAIVYVGFSILSLDVAVVVALLFILYRAAPRLASMNNLRQVLVASLSALSRVEKTVEETFTPKVVSGPRPFSGLHRSIELKNVRFSYDGVTEVFRDASFQIGRGEMTAIVGASGVGKTTLVDLILRYYDPVGGEILVDGVDLKELDLTSWRRSIGVVSQDTFLFNDTVANNITLGRPEVSEANLVEAATQAYAHDFIQQLPKGYQTEIGDRGWNLSGGQRQRLALARAILTKPDILILDEPTSSLDSESEQLIQTYIREIRGSCTLVVVAHRMSTIQDADKIVVLEDGKVAEEGDLATLMAAKGAFANNYLLQTARRSK